MSNPLVATPAPTSAVAGAPLLESATELNSALQSGDWASAAMGAVGAGLDMIGAIMDPFGTILANGVGWLMEHIGPLKEALDALAGDPDQITAHAETWQNVADELTAISGDLDAAVKADTTQWAGEAGDAYRTRAADIANLLGASQQAAAGASSGVKVGGEVVAAVRGLVRDIIAELIGRLISWAIQAMASLGIGLVWVVPQAVRAIASTVQKIATITTKLVKAMSKLSPLIKRAEDIFSQASKALKKIDGGTVPAGGKPGKPGPGKGGRAGGPNGDRTSASGAGGSRGSHGPGSGGGRSRGLGDDTGDDGGGWSEVPPKKKPGGGKKPAGGGGNRPGGGGGNRPPRQPYRPPPGGQPEPGNRPKISNDVHDHVIHGKQENGMPTGGHVHKDDGGGVLNPRTDGRNHQPNGVYTQDSVYLSNDPEGKYRKQQPSTLFAPGDKPADVKAGGNAAWNNGAPSHGLNPDGTWAGHAKINGKWVRIQGFYDTAPGGGVTSYFPSKNQYL
ncbi:EndoU domain-containing protein [Amycolatopsis decaplanina]|uniref:RHS repeat-containing protein n=1 Tax=Amycolatopsis decaplanina DSM 44594 TaxID=1284240 RepID=M2YW58_9PSEU|nr:EndoU domain-containing protein [Amycolatopsis decaplanina]EME52948.1 RHS repeat-containing protein [Amycolatopsis decaplanina DSM 44594]